MGVAGDIKRNFPFNLVEEEILITSCPRYAFCLFSIIQYSKIPYHKILGALDFQHTSDKTPGFWCNVQRFIYIRHATGLVENGTRLFHILLTFSVAIYSG